MKGSRSRMAPPSLGIHYWPSPNIHFNDKVYEDPLKFDGFRFSKNEGNLKVLERKPGSYDKRQVRITSPSAMVLVILNDISQLVKLMPPRPMM